jgi:hypothetical protein
MTTRPQPQDARIIIIHNRTPEDEAFELARELAAELWPVTKPLGCDDVNYQAINEVRARLDPPPASMFDTLADGIGDQPVDVVRDLESSLNGVIRRKMDAAFIYGLAFGLALAGGGR